MPNILYNFSLVIAIIMTVAGITWLVPHAKGNKLAVPFIFAEAIVLNWLVSMLLEIYSTNIVEQRTAAIMGWISAAWIGASFFIFSLYFIDSKLTKRPIIPLLFLIPNTITYIIFLTDPIHHFFFNTYEFQHVVPGTGYIINMIFSYALTILGLINITLRSIKVYRKKKFQMWLVIGAAFAPLGFHILSLTRTTPAEFDFTAVSFAVSAILILIAGNRFEFFTITPVAANQIMDKMKDIVIILNSENYVKYANHAFKDEFLVNETELTTYQLYDLLNTLKANSATDQHHKIEELLQLSDTGNIEIEINNKIYSIRKQIIYKSNGKSVLGSSILMADMTEYYESSKQIQIKNEELTEANMKLINLNVLTERLSAEKERTRISYQLHDSLGHDIVKLMNLIKLETLERDDNSDGLKQALDLSTNLLESVRDTVRGIPDNSVVNISSKLKMLKENMKNLDIEINITFIGDEQDNHLFASETIFSVCREAITNSIRHSEAKKIDIAVKLSEQEIKLLILDNGKGCEKINKNMGLYGMEQSINSIGGKIEFKSNENGFRTYANIPVKEEVA